MITTPSGIILPPGIQSAEVSSLGALNHGMRVELLHILDEIQRRSQMRQLESMFPDGGPFARNLYTRHLEFFACGTHYSQRVFMAANRVGKTMGAGTEWTYHLTGEYPHWWTGYRFNRPIRLLVSGDTHETTRDILQLKLLGSTTDRPEMFGTGLIPGRCIKSITARRGNVQGAVERALIRRKGGGESELWFRSYEQGRQIFQGFELDGFWPDEECPQDVYEEGLVRLMTRKGICTLTFTPLQGLTELVQNLQESEGEEASIKIVQCGWEDVPHLDENEKRKLYAALPPHQRDARTKGIPQLGSGAIYPIDDEEIIINDFKLPRHFERGYGLDVGWNCTAATFLALDRDNDCVYQYAEHYRGQAEPAIHSTAIQARGKWLRGAIDPASRGRSQTDGTQLLKLYQDLGLDLAIANNAVEAGIYETWMRFSTGRLKIFRSCQNTLAERRIYRRDDKGKIVKKKDHALDGLRYGVNTMGQIMRPLPAPTFGFGANAQATSRALDPAMGY
jgi:phage terminase large subunit-like protein